jgi:hypothetical protein
MKYVRQDNCFPWVEGWDQAQRLLDRATDKLAEVARADRTGVEPGAHADVSELSDELLLDDLSERVGHRRGVGRRECCDGRTRDWCTTG